MSANLKIQEPFSDSLSIPELTLVFRVPAAHLVKRTWAIFKDGAQVAFAESFTLFRGVRASSST